MKCNQCDKQAMYRVEESIPLCLDCFFKWSQIQQQDRENNERMINYLQDQMAYTVGLPQTGPRFPPRPQSVVIAEAKLHNIHVSNSVVGFINTGSIGTVDQSISALIQTGKPEMADAVKNLSEAILRSGDLTPNQKNELIESLSVIVKEAVTPKETRQNTVALSLLEKAKNATSVAKDISEICQKLWPVLHAVFT